MKTTLIIAAATLVGTLLVKYLMKTREAEKEILDTVPVKRSHHVTDVFAHAKNHSE